MQYEKCFSLHISHKPENHTPACNPIQHILCLGFGDAKNGCGGCHPSQVAGFAFAKAKIGSKNNLIKR